MEKQKRYIVLVFNAIMILSVFSCSTQTNHFKPVDYVDPLIGAGCHGHVFVGASVPFGAVQIGPNNIYKGWDWCSGYHYSDSLIIGFSQLHLNGTGIGDLADVLIMPFTGKPRLDKGVQEFPHGGYLSTFSHDHETVKPGYYSVIMNNGVKVELGATERVGFHRYYFPEKVEAHIVIDLKEGINDRSTGAALTQVDEYTLLGHRFSRGWAKEQQVYFAIRSSVPITELKLYEDTSLIENTNADSKDVKGLIGFDSTPALVALKVGISPVSSKNALANIDSEIPDWDFERVVASARKKWNDELSSITIETQNEADKRIFYTSLFHSCVHPSLFNDVNGDYQGADNRIYTNADFNNYTVLSFWDTYRAAHPLYTITQPDRVDDFVNTMLAIYDEQGYLPIWHLFGYDTKTMVGISSLQVIAEAYLKGYRGFDAGRAFEAIKTTSMLDIEGLNYLRELKPIPYDVGLRRTVAQAMELSISDGSTALMAKAMGREDDFEYFSKRAKNYQLYYDKSVGFFRGIKSDGSWNPVFFPLSSKKSIAKDYAEGNAWQYLWLVPHDVPGLIDLMGGKDQFIARLDSFFTIETEAGEQWKTAEKVRYIMKEFYKDDPDGVIGNEDAGQMSAWYVFSSLGFYPVFPASQEYVLGSPLFDKATIHLPEGKSFTVIAENNSDDNIYIQQVELNGLAYKNTSINHQDIMSGGELKIVMGNSPNPDYGNN